MKKYCIICAHPDDETLFFSSILNSFGQDCIVHCLTDGNADGRGDERKKEFSHAMKYFEVTNFKWSGLADIYELNIEQNKLEKEIQETINSLPKDSIIFTHGPFGDYGHPHHIQVALVVHRIAFKKGISVYHPNVLALEAGTNPFQIKSEDTWVKKLYVLENIYHEEYRRFVSLIPAKANESFIESDETTLRVLEFFDIDNKDEEIKGDLGLLGPFKNSLEIFKKNGLLRKF
jgi:LmbE family N-acetylglucosaminyl deacetylase